MQQYTKQEFLSALTDSLRNYSDLTDEMVERQVKQFERYFTRMSDEEAQAAIADFDSTEAIAANIYEFVKEKGRQKSEEGAEAQSAPPRTRGYDHTASDFTVVESRTASDADATAMYDAVKSADVEIINKSGDNFDDTGGETINLDRVMPDKRTDEPADDQRGHLYNETYNFGGTRLDFASLDDAPHPTAPIFWVLLALTFPLITVFALFLFAFTALATLIVALVASMIGIVAAGTGLSLFGIIYGITQTFNIFPAGLFEIGLGVTIGGSAMFAGIAVYNLAIRFLPFVMGKLTIFLRFTLRLVKQLFLRLKKECVSQ